MDIDDWNGWTVLKCHVFYSIIIWLCRMNGNYWELFIHQHHHRQLYVLVELNWPYIGHVVNVCVCMHFTQYANEMIWPQFISCETALFIDYAIFSLLLLCVRINIYLLNSHAITLTDSMKTKRCRGFSSCAQTKNHHANVFKFTRKKLNFSVFWWACLSNNCLYKSIYSQYIYALEHKSYGWPSQIAMCCVVSSSSLSRSLLLVSDTAVTVPIYTLWVSVLQFSW